MYTASNHQATLHVTSLKEYITIYRSEIMVHCFRARAYEIYHRANLRPKLFHYKNWEHQARAYSELFEKPGLSSLKPRAYILRA